MPTEHSRLPLCSAWVQIRIGTDEGFRGSRVRPFAGPVNLSLATNVVLINGIAGQENTTNSRHRNPYLMVVPTGCVMRRKSPARQRKVNPFATIGQSRRLAAAWLHDGGRSDGSLALSDHNAEHRHETR